MNIDITIEGSTPLLCNRFSEDAAMAATSRTRATKIGNETPEESCEKKLYKNDSGELIIPQMNLLSCLMEAGTYHKIGRSKVTTVRKSLIPAVVKITPIELLIHSEKGWYPFETRVVNPSTSGAFNSARPRFNDWKINFEVDLDDTYIPVNLFRNIVDDAGKMVGLGDWRPTRKGPFGCFKVINWSEKKRRF